MKFVVKDNGHDANSHLLEILIAKIRGTQEKEPPADSPWKNNEFPTFEEALVYAKAWLGTWDTLPADWDGSPYDYSGLGDKISIEKIAGFCWLAEGDRPINPDVLAASTNK